MQNCRIQGAGVGGLRHNTVLLGWPNNWRRGAKSYKAFIGKYMYNNFRSLRNFHFFHSFIICTVRNKSDELRDDYVER